MHALAKWKALGKINFFFFKCESDFDIKTECHSLGQEALIDVLSFLVLRWVLHSDAAASWCPLLPKAHHWRRLGGMWASYWWRIMMCACVCSRLILYRQCALLRIWHRLIYLTMNPFPPSKGLSQVNTCICMLVRIYGHIAHKPCIGLTSILSLPPWILHPPVHHEWDNPPHLVGQKINHWSIHQSCHHWPCIFRICTTRRLNPHCKGEKKIT